MKKKPSGKKLWIVTGLSIALIGGVAFWRNFINANPHIVIPPYPTAPKPNGYDVYIKAAKMIVRANPAVDEVNDGSPPTDPKVCAQQYSLANKEAWLQLNVPMFKTFQSALTMKCLAPPRVNSLFPSFASLRELARCKSIERHACELRGDWDSAMQSQIDTVQMGNDIARGGALISGLVSVAIEAIGRSDPWTNVEHLTAIQARAAIKRLEAINNRRFTYAAVMQEEKWSSVSMLLNAMRKQSWNGVFINPSATSSTGFKISLTSKRAAMNNLIEMFDVEIANAKLSYTTPQKPLPPGDFYTQLLASSYEKARVAFARNNAGNALWLTALALRAYKLEHNSYPATLQTLVPNYLKQVPVDPFGGGEELRYKIAGNTYVLWSIGPDGVNNNGTPISWPASASAEQRKKLPQVGLDSAGDYVAGKNR